MPLAVNPHPTARVAAPIRWSPDDLLGKLQLTLRAVGDVELRHELAREGLELSAGLAFDEQGCLAALEALRQVELEPYARRLDALERRIRSLMA